MVYYQRLSRKCSIFATKLYDLEHTKHKVFKMCNFNFVPSLLRSSKLKGNIDFLLLFFFLPILCNQGVLKDSIDYQACMQAAIVSHPFA